MIKQFEVLTQEEKNILLKAPILFSVLAISNDQEISKEKKADAIRLAHLKTFTADPLLLQYYMEVEKNFEIYFETIIKKYFPFDDAKREALKKEMNLLNDIISKLDKDFAQVLHKSLSGYAEHVRKAERNFLENFIFPVPLQGITD